jgi:FkbM family methyltransferase
MISWAGHGEDQILHRILINRPPGTYIDIGAAHPKFGSITFALYELSWRGICIEPREELSKYWRKIRPNDLFINAALTIEGKDGFISNQGFRSKFIEENERISGTIYSKTSALSTAQLSSITSEELKMLPTFIKIDIEGDEYKIVESLLANGFLPEIWIIEVIDQFNSEHIRRDSSKELKILLESYKYRMALFDGVNEWYAEKSSEALNRNIWAPAYPGVENFIPFHLTINYRIRNYIHSRRQKISKQAKKWFLRYW